MISLHEFLHVWVYFLWLFRVRLWVVCWYCFLRIGFCCQRCKMCTIQTIFDILWFYAFWAKGNFLLPWSSWFFHQMLYFLFQKISYSSELTFLSDSEFTFHKFTCKKVNFFSKLKFLKNHQIHNFFTQNFPPKNSSHIFNGKILILFTCNKQIHNWDYFFCLEFH